MSVFDNLKLNTSSEVQLHVYYIAVAQIIVRDSLLPHIPRANLSIIILPSAQWVMGDYFRNFQAQFWFSSLAAELEERLITDKEQNNRVSRHLTISVRCATRLFACDS